MLANLSAPDNIGAAMAVALLTPLYATVVSEIFFAFIFKAYSKQDEDGMITPLSLRNVAIAGAVIVFMLITFLTLLMSFPDLSGNT